MPKSFVSLIFLSQIALAAPTKPGAPTVFTETLARADLFDTLSYPARLVPKINATLLSESEGVVEKILTPLGSAVKKGAAVLKVVHTDPLYQYAPLLIQAPVSGVVSSMEVTEGSRVTQGTKLAAITDPSNIKIQIEVSAGDLSAIKRGTEGTLTLPSMDGEYPVKVVGLSPFVDPATGTASGELVLVKRKNELPVLPGLVGKVSFKAREHKGVQVPDSAIVYRGQDAFIRVLNDKNQAKYVKVTLGPTRSGSVEILKGLEGGEKVIVRASSFINEGEEVSVQDLTPPSADNESKKSR